MRKWMKGALLIAGVAVGATAGTTAYFYRRTMKRYNAKVEQTMKMAGTDWTQYFPLIEERKEYMLAQPHADVHIMSDDGLRLHGTYFPVINTNARETYRADRCDLIFVDRNLSGYGKQRKRCGAA